MEYYELGTDEVRLYRCDNVHISAESKPKTRSKKADSVVVTNLNIVLVTHIKTMLKKETETEVYPLETIKVYKDEPYILRNDERVELYFLNGERYLTFEEKKQAKMFVDHVKRAASGNSKFVRMVKKVQREINETGEALHIDVAKVAKGVAETAVKLAVNAGGIPEAGKTAQRVGYFAKLLAKDKKEEKALLVATDSLEDSEAE